MYRTALLVCLPLLVAPLVLLVTVVWRQISCCRKAKQNDAGSKATDERRGKKQDKRRSPSSESQEENKKISNVLSVWGSVQSSMLLVVNLLYPEITRSCLLLLRCQVVFVVLCFGLVTCHVPVLCGSPKPSSETRIEVPPVHGHHDALLFRGALYLAVGSLFAGIPRNHRRVRAFKGLLVMRALYFALFLCQISSWNFPCDAQAGFQKNHE